jgi:hypothetical protein
MTMPAPASNPSGPCRFRKFPSTVSLSGLRKPPLRSIVVLLLLTCAFPGVCRAQECQKNASDTARCPNGISVGRPKVFDNRTLTLMLESLSDNLRNLQFVDPKTLAAAFSLVQGFQSTESTSNISVTTLPIPGLKQETVTKAGNVDTSGKSLPDTTQRTTTTNRDTITPQAPTLDMTPSFTGFNPSYGENASDLLSDQVNLSYQIFNLRMLLERSLSDRLESDQPRLQGVLGFNVTIDPPRTANDAVAVVEITLSHVLERTTTEKSGGQTVESKASGDATGDEQANEAEAITPLSLVSLMPQEKTYNSAALSTKSHAFAGAAVAKIVQVGYNQRKRSQVFYLYRDNDTVSYERMVPGNANKIVFGWMFRPVLGRRSVSPGLRQLFAIVALSAADRCGVANPESTGNPRVFPKCSGKKLDASVRTFWKKYHAGTATSFEERDANLAARVGYGLSLHLSKPELFEARYENRNEYGGIEVRPTGGYQARLKPQVDKAFWMPVGSKSALVSAQGANFFTGTQVVIGDKTYSSVADGLILKSNEAFDLTISLDALASGPGAIIGRYGGAVPLILPNPGATADGIEIQQVIIGPSLSGSRSVEVHLRNRRTDDDGTRLPLRLSELPKTSDSFAVSPIVTLNGNTVALPYSLADGVTTSDAPESHVVLQAIVPDAYVATGTSVAKVFWPFFADNWTATKHYYDPASAFQITRLSSKSAVIVTKDILGFVVDPRDTGNSHAVNAGQYCWKLLAGDKPVLLASSVCTAGDTKLTTAISPAAIAVTMPEAIPDKVVLVSPLGATWALDVPKLQASTDTKPITLNQYDSSWVDVPVEDVSKVASVEANQQKLNFRPGKPAKPGDKVKTINVEITRDLTAKAGTVDLSILDKDGKVLTTVKVQISCVDCKTNGAK